MDNYFNDPRLQQASTNYQTAATEANRSAEADISLPSLLKETLNQKFTTNNPVIAQREVALKDYLNSIPESQAAVLPENQGGTILSPIHQADLITKRQSAKLAPLSTLNYILGLQTGGIGDVIESASRAHQGMTASKQNKAELARNVYGDLLNELSTKAKFALDARDQAFKEKQFEENVRQFGLEYALSVAKLSADSSKPLKVPANLQKGVKDFNSVQQAINLLVEQGKKIKSKLGKSGTLGKIQSKIAITNAQLGRDPELKRYLDLQNSLASLLAKGVGGETGVLTDKDIQRALSFTSGGTPTQADLELALRDLRDVQKNAKYNLKTQFKLTGLPYDESYVVPGAGGGAIRNAAHTLMTDWE